jgi:glucose/arabinose dehydrogenase
LRVAASVVVMLMSTAFTAERVAAAPVLPAGFADDPVVSVGSPTDIAFTPDGRMLITTQPGRLRIVADGALLPTAALDLVAAGTVCSNSERGMLGVAVDPGFAVNGYIYIFWTFKKYGACPTNTSTAPVNRVSRFTLSPPPDNTVDPASEVVLIDNIESPAGSHNAGDLHVGADGLLYVTVGDGSCRLTDATMCAADNDNARHLDTLLGKVLRIGLDGSIPSGNPYASAPGARRCGDPAGGPAGTGPCSETFASGLRNPFRFAFKPGTNEFHINDVGQATWEEIDLGSAGADYGWNVREGFCATGSTTDCAAPPAGMTNPIHVYGHSAGCKSITGGAFVPVGVWPSAYDGAYLFSDYICGKIFRLVPNGSGGFDQVEFVTGLGANSAVAMQFGPYGSTQALYYTTYAGGGSVRRISATSTANQIPIANAGSASTATDAPVAISLTGSDVETCELTFDVPATTLAGGTLSGPSSVGCATGSPNSDSASVTYTPPGGFSGPDSFSFTVGDGTATSTPKTISITVGGTGGTATFSAAADAQVYSSQPTTNYGTATSMRTREGNATSSNPTYRSYVQFNVAGVSGPVSDVKLRLWVTDPSPGLQNVYALTPDDWIESGTGSLTYNRVPAMDTPASPLGGAAAPTSGAWVEIDLANSAVGGNGLVSFAIRNAGTNSAIFSTREGAHAPQLVVAWGA